MTSDVKIIGITGGIGSGKSLVASFIKEKGYKVISSDDTSKEIMGNDSDVRKRIRSLIGNNSFLEDGSLNKKFIADKIFGKGNEEILEKVNQIIHPKVIEANMEKIEALIDEGEKVIFVESALLFEVGLEEGFDFIITVYSDNEKVIERLKNNRKMNDIEIKLRLDSQMSPIEKKKLSDFTIENNGSIDLLRKSTEMVLQIILP